MGTYVAIIVAVVAQAGLVLSAVVSKRRSKQDRQQVAFDFIQDLNEELRTELKRRAAEYLADLTTHATATNVLQQQVRQARDEVSQAHMTAGRARQRVEYLESLLRRNGISFQPEATGFEGLHGPAAAPPPVQPPQASGETPPATE